MAPSSTRGPADTRASVPRALLVLTSVGLSAGLLLSRIPLLATREFDPDELEHTHVAFCILRGQVPFRDFFEHHTPIFHYLLAGLLSLVDLSGSPDAAMHALFVARYLTWGISVAIVALVFVLARRLRDATTAWVALPIVSGGIVLALRALEIRPDGLSTVLWMASVLALHAGLIAPRPSARSTRRAFLFSGLAIGLAVLTSQKLLLAGPALAVLVVWYLASSRFAGSLGDRLVNVALQAAAAGATWGLALAWFAHDGAARDFLRLTLFDNLKWKSETTAGTILSFIVRYEPWLFALAAGGAGVVLREVLREPSRVVSGVVLIVAASGLFAGLFVVPVPYAQYCLTFLPFFAILAATALVVAARGVAASAVSRGPRDWSSATIVLGVVAIASLGLWMARPVIVAVWVYPLVVAGALGALLAVRWHQAVEITLAVLLVALAILPAQWSAWMLALGDKGQFDKIRYVLAHTTPDDVVLDGWTGYGALRPHATYYWMLHAGVRAMLSSADVDAMTDSVVSGRVRPKVVILDPNLRAVSPAIADFVESHYQPAGAEIFVRSAD